MNNEEVLEKLKDYHLKLGRALEALQRGEEPILEAFDDSFFEARQSENKCFSNVARMIENILKVHCCLSSEALSRNRNKWKHEFELHRDRVIDITMWRSKRREVNLIQYIERNMPDIYENGINLVKKAAQKYPDLLGVTNAPEVCPWRLEELMEEEIEDLQLSNSNTK